MRKLLAVLIFAALVFPLLMGALSLMAVSQWALDRDFYEQLLGDVRLYEVLLDEDLPNYLNNRYPVPEADMIPSGALSNALRQVVTADVDGDRRRDLVLLCHDRLLVYLAATEATP